jgi:hypothetical protein
MISRNNQNVLDIGDTVVKKTMGISLLGREKTTQ